MNPSFWHGKRVLVTGHTGFKGSWLCLWLQKMGARVTGLSLPPEGAPSLFELGRVAQGMDSRFGDVRDIATVQAAVRESQPEIALHLAAQPLVRRSYREPVETFATNVMGTAHVLEAARATDSVKVCLIITTDKCYENREWDYPYRENDTLGGHDPYSASKACAEFVSAAYRRSFCEAAGISVATARAGNVIGGGDWSEDRIIPDCVRALEAGRAIEVRNPGAVRPWQHVLEPLAGYLRLARRQWEAPQDFARPWNFGPDPANVLTVGELVERFVAHWGEGRQLQRSEASAPHEAGILQLDISRTRTRLGWRPVFDIASTVSLTVDWYRQCHARDVRNLCEGQIAAYESAAGAQA